MGLLDMFKKPQKKDLPPELEEKMKAIAMMLFPNGHRDIQEGGTTVRKLSRDKLSQGESEKLFASVKSLLVISEDKTPERIKGSIVSRTNGRLSSTELQAIYLFISGDSGLSPYCGGDGKTQETAVIINYTTSAQGIKAEYQYLEQHYGRQDKDWKVEMRAHGTHGNRSMSGLLLVFRAGKNVPCISI